MRVPCSREFVEPPTCVPNSTKFTALFPNRARVVDGQTLWAPAVRPALIVGIGLAIFQQVTGINTVIYYAPTIIQSAGISSASGAILATAGIGVVNVLMTIFAMW